MGPAEPVAARRAHPPRPQARGGGSLVSELDRIREAYRERDASQDRSQYSWLRPPFARYMLDMEWELLRGARRAGVPLEGARVLDIGCGTGYHVHRLLDLGAAAGAGIDLME